MKMTIRTPEELKLEAARANAAAFLRDTDWMVIRAFETGKEIPEEIAQKRADAREILSSP